MRRRLKYHLPLPPPPADHPPPPPAMGTHSSAASGSNTAVQTSPSPDPFENGHPIRTQMKKKTKTIKKKISIDDASSSSSASSSFSSFQRNSRTHLRRKVVIAPLHRRGGDAAITGENLDAIALPLGMSFAAVITQVLEKKDVQSERMSAELLSMICTTAVRESLANVFGNKFELFASNFQRSFRSTLRTLRVISESPFHRGPLDSGQLNPDKFGPDVVSIKPVAGSTSCSSTRNFYDESDLPFSLVHNRVHSTEEIEGGLSTVSLTRELTVHGQMNQLTCSPSSLGSRIVAEQARSNDLKELEIGLSMRRLKLEMEQIALSEDSNRLKESKLTMGKEKASFKAEKFKTQQEDTRHAELLQKCIDCLVAGLFIMSASLCYSAYVYSHRRITEATQICAAPFEESKSWWMPKSVSSLNSGLHTLRCQVEVVSRMVFGVLMILAVAYLLLQRSATAQQRMMPVTTILLILGVACGFAGKLCVDTLGGDGFLWLLLWESICLLHFLTNLFTSTVFHILCGSLDISQGHRRTLICPYWARRSIFYTITLLVLPLCCGLLPFAGVREWTDHFYMLAMVESI